jgi:DNA-binding SARP family transcriptional activator/tetratricopeptide (TPR) repeat protein
VSGALEFRVLGPLEVVYDGVAKRIGSPTQRTLLALLLMHPNEVVSTDWIVDVLWHDDPSEARRKLWFHVSKLRAILQPGGAEDAAAAVLETRPTGYTLRIDLDQLDAARFERLARAAWSTLEDEPARGAEMLRRALALWRGRPFADVLHEDAVSSEVARLDELRLTALEGRLDADLALGHGGELVPELAVLAAEHPFREHVCAQLMLALYRAGRHADALATYRQARQTFVAELGIEPSERLKELHSRILCHDPSLVGSRPPPPRTGAPRAERKLVTVFADLTEFAASSVELDPEDIRAVLSPYYAHIRSDLERFGGTVEKLTGVSATALFGVPAAHEDDPERAVRAALALRDWFHEHDRQVRMAVATGEAYVTLGAIDREGEPVVVGDVVGTAARLQAAAPAAGVLVSEQTFRATRYAIEYREAEPLAATGKVAQIRAWEAIRALAEPGVDLLRHYSPFIGRERELAALQERLAWAASQRSPQLVTILGVPGIGKTRLVSELQQTNARTSEPARWRQGRSLPYGDGVSFWALGEMVKAEAGILESDAAPKANSKLRKAVRRAIGDPAEAGRIATFLGALVGLGGEEPATGDHRRETFAAWRRFIEALADECPLVLVFEDLHWADDALLDFVDDLVDQASGVPLLVIATSRPELLERRSGWGGGKPGALTISLPPLSRSDTTHLVTALLEQSTVPAETHEALLARIGGNPLYAEQLCRMLVEHGRLEELPDSLRSIIAARLDALADVEKRVLQDAAVVGKAFWASALETITGISRRDAEEFLHALVRREFVRRARPSSVAGDIEYVFCHELLRDVAYEEIPRAARAERHRRAAEWIDSLGRPEDHAELLAHHYLAALEDERPAGVDVSMLVERAEQALHRAGLRAIRLSANERAVEHFSRAIALVGRLPEGDERTRREAELHVQLGVALFALRGLGAPEVEQAYTRATELMLASASTAGQFPAHFGLSIYHGHRGDFDRSMRLVDRLTELASEGDDSMKLQALHARWMNSLFGGRVDDAVAAADEARVLYRPEAHHQLSFLYGNHDPGVCALALQALAFALRGESVKAVTQMHEAISLAEALGHAATLAQPLTQLPWALQINGDAETALLESERALALEEEVAHPQFFGIAHAMRGWALARMGRDQEGVAELERALADELQSSDIWAAMTGTLLAEAHLRRGRPKAARHVLDDMLSLTQAMPSYVFEPELLRIEAEWLRSAGRGDDARPLLLRAISTARKHGSLALAVRSALTLVRSPLAARVPDLKLLGDLCERLPPDNATDYGREARAVLGEGIATTQP